MIKKKFCIMTIISLIIFLNGCSEINKKFDPNFHIGIIESTAMDNESYLSFYDNNFKCIGSREIPLGSMGTAFDFARTYKDNMYVIPQGISSMKDKTIIMEYNMKTGDYKEYDMKQQALNGFEIDDKYIYSINTFNSNSIFSRLDKITNEIKTYVVKGEYISKIALCGNKLYGFSIFKDGSFLKSKMYILNTVDFKSVEVIDTTQYGISCGSTLFVNDDLYITYTTTKSSDSISEIPGNKMIKFNILEKSIFVINLDEVSPLQLIQNNDKLIITHCDLVQLKGMKITIYDLKTGEKKIKTLKNNLLQTQIDNDKIYSIDSDNLYIYKLSDFELEKTIDIHSKKNNQPFFYVSSFFIKG